MRVLAALCLALLAAAAVTAAPKTLPNAWKQCSKTDPELGTCLRDAVNVAVQQLSEKGAKELGVFPIEPLTISHLDIDQGQGPVSIELHFSDLNIHGLKGVVVTDRVTADVDNIRFKVPISLEAGVKLIGNYKVNGKVLVLPIKGEGPCELKLDNMTVTAELQGKPLVKDGQTYADIFDFKFRFDTTRLHLKMENLFNGQKELSAQMNVFLNENWKEILRELKPAIQDAFGAAFGEITNRIFHKVPYDQLFQSTN